MESLKEFLVTFAAGLPAFLCAAVFLSVLRGRMVRLRRSGAGAREKRIRGAIGALASLMVLPLLPLVLFLVARGVEAGESVIIASVVFGIPLSLLVARSLATCARTVYRASGTDSAGGKVRGV